MNIEILDCTLRDGGYVNNWNFSANDIKGISKHLNIGNIEKIELGYITGKERERGTLFNSLSRVSEIEIPNYKKILMINYGELEEENIPENKEKIFGIRVVFRKDDMKKALEYSLNLKIKGYNIFLQPMQTISYKDNELLELIEKANEINPYALYIVDSFGEMRKEDLLRVVSIYSHNLKKNIKIGFHSHNNLQLSFALGIEFLNCNMEQGKIIDSSIYGMGRGAGNLNTELIAEYMNKYFEKHYKIENFLNIMDLYLEKIYQKEKWGYNLGHFISAKLGCHPNYASYLLEKRSIAIETIKKILKDIPDNEKNIFNKSLINKLYLFHQKEKSITKPLTNLKELELKENVLIIGPGVSVLNEKEKINKFILKNNTLTVISLNHKNIFIKSDFLFFSNERRFEEFNENFKKLEKIILTTNIKNKQIADYILDYSLYSNEVREVLSSEIIFNILESDEKVKKIYIAGLDGYSKDERNYYFETEETINKDFLNKKLIYKLKQIKKKIEFLTKSIYMEEN